jgi:hypothetical protein
MEACFPNRSPLLLRTSSRSDAVHGREQRRRAVPLRLTDEGGSAAVPFALMRDRLEVENAELARSFRAAEVSEQARVADQMVQRAVAAQDPPLELPADAAQLHALVAELDASEDMSDFPRARAASAAEYLRGAAYEDALYEALHAHHDISNAVADALNLLR